MIPTTYPSFLNPFSDQAECKVSYLSSVSGLTAWTDYIPVQTVVYSGNVEGRTEANGYQAVHPVGATGNVAWTDYVPVYEDATKTVAWSTDANGYIPIGLSEDGVLAFLETAEFGVELTHTAVPTAAAPGTTATFTRATTKTVENNDGYLVTLLAGEIGFPGARRVDNLIRLGAAQSSTLAIAANVTMTLPSGAYQFSMGAGTGTATFSGTGGATGTLAASASGRVSIAKTIAAGTLIVTGSVAILNDIQVVSMVAETDQTTIREYVSVGVESAPYYHGSFVDGVKCFPTDLAGNALPTAYTYDAVSLNGVAGTYVSTPDSVANSITGDIDIRVKAALTDWTPSANSVLLAKRNGTGAYYLAVLTGGTLDLEWWDSGGVNRNSVSTVATGLPDGTTKYIRATLDVDNDAGGNDVKFYLSDDGVAWTQLGSTVTQAFTTSIRDTTDTIDVGSQIGGAASNVSGKIYRAQIYNGINGTLAVDFDASRYAGGTTLTGSTGETWTLQGNAIIHPTNNPMRRYNAEGARTNISPYSNTFTSWSASGTPTLSQNIVGPDGATSGWTITDDSGAAAEFPFIGSILTAATHTASIFVAKTTGAQSSYPVIWLDASATNSALCTIDTSNGVATVWTAHDTRAIVTSSASCKHFNDDWWRVSITFAATADTWSVYAIPAGTANATQATGAISTAVTGSAGLFGYQLELGSSASSYISTGAASASRAADVLTYSLSGNMLDTKGWAYGEATTDGLIPGWNNIIVGDANAGSYPLYLKESTAKGAIYDGTTEVSFGSALTIPITSPVKVASTWGGSTMTGSVSGSSEAPSSFDGVMNITNIGIGHAGGNSQLFGNIGPIYIGQRQLSASEMRAITQ